MEFVPGLPAFSPWEPGFLSWVLYGLLVLILVALLLFIAAWLGEKKEAPQKQVPFECGISPTGSARFRYPVPFYLVAVFFLIFDVEAVYILAWAIAVKPLGWSGWLQISFFTLVLLISLFYIWKKGGLEWGPTPRNISKDPKT